MQIRKEILLFSALVLLCITLILAADAYREPIVKCQEISPAWENCCKTYMQNNSNTSPWNFITQGILHLAV